MSIDYGVTRQGLMFQVDEQGRPVIADADLAEMTGEEIRDAFALAATIHESRSRRPFPPTQGGAE